MELARYMDQNSIIKLSSVKLIDHTKEQLSSIPNKVRNQLRLVMVGGQMKGRAVAFPQRRPHNLLSHFANNVVNAVFHSKSFRKKLDTLGWRIER